ncbi:hypothetical protein AALC25_09570 [Lachnospiraceae bacterium 29-84]
MKELLKALQAAEEKANEIVRTTSGRINFQTASTMIRKKRAELESLIARKEK